jgi:hypothetical protein
MKMTKAEVADEIEAFVEGTGGEWDWDDFIHIPIDNPELERIRLRCEKLPEEFPPSQSGYYCSSEGIRVLEEIARELRQTAG